MANVGSGAAGKTLIGSGNGASPQYATIGTNSGLTNNGVIIGGGNNGFTATSSGSMGQILTSNGASLPPSFKAASVSALNSNGNWYVSNQISNVTGDGTNYQVVFDTQDYLNGSDVSWNAATGAFTINTTGTYQWGWGLGIFGFSSNANDLQGYIGGGGGGPLYDNPGAHYDSHTYGGVTYFVMAQRQISSGATIACQFSVNGDGSKTVSLSGSSGQLFNYLFFNRIA